MKGNDGTGNNESRDSWITNQELWDNLNKQYKFTFDCCANKENTKCSHWSNNLQDAYIGNDVAWMNPPFSKARLMFEIFFQKVFRGVAIYRCDNMETKIWQEIILKNANWIFIPKGRINYEGMIGKGSRFPSALIGFNVDPPKNFKQEGSILFLEKD